MKFLFASDSFKGSMSSQRIAELLECVSADVFPEVEVSSLCVADGGEGTMDAVVQSLGGYIRSCVVSGPLGDPVEARYGVLPHGRALIEMAEASGITLISDAERNLQKTTSYGSGELIRDALDLGIRDITVAVGGSATNDGGMGAMRALGVVFLDEYGQPLEGRSEDLHKVHVVNIDDLHPAVVQTRFTVMTDVHNPLLGTTGATLTFGAQKGGDQETLFHLEEGMKQYAQCVSQIIGRDDTAIPGAGAAGGLAYALIAFLNASPLLGIEAVLDLLDFDERLHGVDLVVTGEGRLDWQSSFGKVVSGVGRRCKRAGVPAVAIVGGLLSGYDEIYDHGICSVMTTINGAMSIEEAMIHSETLYLDAARRLFRLLRCGMQIQKS